MVAADQNVKAQEALIWGLVEHRMAQSLSVAQLADKLGTYPEMVDAIESGDYELNLTELRQYAYALGVVVEYKVVTA